MGNLMVCLNGRRGIFQDDYFINPDNKLWDRFQECENFTISNTSLDEICNNTTGIRFKKTKVRTSKDTNKFGYNNPGYIDMSLEPYCK